MSNFSISLDLKKLKNSCVKEMQGKNGNKKCLIIPIDDAGLKEYKDSLYLNISATECRNNNYGQSHSIKQQISKDAYFALSAEEKKAIPFIGNMKPMNFGGSSNSGVSAANPQPTSASSFDTTNEEDLPF